MSFFKYTFKGEIKAEQVEHRPETDDEDEHLGGPKS